MRSRVKGTSKLFAIKECWYKTLKAKGPVNSFRQSSPLNQAAVSPCITEEKTGG
jgi:hypothetical protein